MNTVEPSTVMRMSWSIDLASSLDDVFRWHQQPEAIEALIPPDKTVKVVQRTGGIEDENSLLVFRIFPLGFLFGTSLPLYITWQARHHDFIQSQQFIDTQEKGPFAYWSHIHRFKNSSTGGCCLRDDVTFALPLAPISHMLAGWWVKKELQAMFAYRHRVLAQRFGLASLNRPVLESN